MEALATKRSNYIDDILLLIGQTLSQVSDRMVQLGLIWFITSGYGENYLIWYLVVGGLPHAFLVKHSSLAIQALGSLKTVLFSDLARGLVYLFVFALILIFPEWLKTSASNSILWLLFISVFISNIFSAFFNPAILSLSVEIKDNDQVQKLTAKLSSITSFTTIVGPILGLFVFNSVGLSGLFIISSISYFASAYAVSLISKTNSKKSIADESTAPVADFKLFGSQSIIGVMLSVFLLMNLLLSPLQILMPSMAKDFFGNSFNALAILETLVGAGVLLGGAVLTVFTINRRPLFWAWAFLVMLSFSFLAFTLSSTLLSAGGSLVVLGFSVGVSNILIINILQTQPNPMHVPQVMSLVNLISTATLPFSLALIGLLQSVGSVFLLGKIAGAVLVIVSIVSFFPFRRFGQEIFK